MLTRTRLSDPDVRDTVRGWLERPRYEVLPLPAVLDELDAVPTGAEVTVTASPKHGPEATLALTEQLVALGHRPIPHLAARQLHDEVELKELLDRLDLLGVEEVFAIGGDSERPVGTFTDAVQLLDALTRLAPRLRVGVAGYPEPHPRIPDAALRDALRTKRRHAAYVVSQVCFDADTITGWIADNHARGIELPTLMGVPGSISTGRLLRVAGRIGVGSSLRFLTGHASMARLIRPGAYDPGDLVADVAAAPAGRPDGLHLYTFNAVAATETWRRQLLEELG